MKSNRHVQYIYNNDFAFLDRSSDDDASLDESSPRNHRTASVNAEETPISYGCITASDEALTGPTGVANNDWNSTAGKTCFRRTSTQSERYKSRPRRYNSAEPPSLARTGHRDSENSPDDPLPIDFSTMATGEAVENVQVEVGKPSLNQESLRYSFYLYPISGILPNGTQFQATKRYRDFVSLRATLQNNLPGICIPSLPSKKSIGRFEPDFVDARRLGLREFLVRVFNRPHICASKFFQEWIQRSGEACLEQLYMEESCKSWRVLYEDYRHAVWQMPASYGYPRPRDFSPRRLDELKRNLQIEIQYLRSILKSINKMASLNSPQPELLSSLWSTTEHLGSHESMLAKEMDVSAIGLPRRLASSFWLLSRNLKSEHPTGNCKTLLSALAVEIRETQTLADALLSVEDLERRHKVLSKRLSETSTVAAAPQNSASGFGRVKNLFTREPSRESALSEDRVVRESLEVTSQWLKSAYGVLICSFKKYFDDKILLVNKAMDEFAQNQMNYHLQAADIWKDYLKESKLSQLDPQKKLPLALPDSGSPASLLTAAVSSDRQTLKQTDQSDEVIDNQSGTASDRSVNGKRAVVTPRHRCCYQPNSMVNGTAAPLTSEDLIVVEPTSHVRLG